MPTGIYKRTEYHRRKISESNTRYWLGKKFSIEHKKKLKRSHKGMLGKKHSEETKLKISKTKKHKPFRFSKEQLVKLSVSHIGQKSYWKGKKRPEISREFHWGWKGGITPINKKIRKSLEYKLWREEIFQRDDYTCQICGGRGSMNLRANHIKKFADYPKLRLESNNGITICRECDERWVLHHEEEWENYFKFNLEARFI